MKDTKIQSERHVTGQSTSPEELNCFPASPPSFCLYSVFSWAFAIDNQHYSR